MIIQNEKRKLLKINKVQSPDLNKGSSNVCGSLRSAFAPYLTKMELLRV